MDKISIIVPVYNTEKNLSRCIDSILSQTYQNLEVILVNDGSSDGSGKIIERYHKLDNRIKVIHKDNGGISSARNAGLDIASGDFVAFVDSDDWIEHDIYEYCLELAKSSKSDVVDYGIVFVKGKHGTSSKEKYNTSTIEGNQEILKDYLLRGQTEKTPFSVCRKFYRLHLFNDVRFPAGKINEDIATNYKVLLKAKKLIKTDKVGYYYFQDSVSTTRNGFRKRDFDLIDASKELITLAEETQYPEIKQLARIKLARSYFSLLAKIAFYGFEDKDINKTLIIRELTNNLRTHYLLLIRAPIPANRKIMITMLCINFKLLDMPIRFYRKANKFLVRRND